MPLPHFDDLDNLEPPPSFQRASPRVCIKGKRKRCAVPGADKHGQFPEAGKYGITTITSSSISKSRTTAASHTNSANKNHSCKNDSYHKSHAPSKRKISLSLERPDTKPALSQSGHASFAAKTIITATSAIDAGAAPRSKPFDPWNSSSTGHQRAENILNGSTAWRESRNAKLSEQFRGGLGGGIIRVADTVGAGSEGFGKDGRKKNGGWEKGASGVRIDGQRSLAEVWEVSKGVKGNDGKVAHVEEPHDVRTSCNAGREDCESSIFFACYHQGQNIDDRPVFNYTISNLCKRGRSRNAQANMYAASQTLTPAINADLPLEVLSNPPAPQNESQKQIFSGLCFYINGSTAPLISDHKLKQMLAERGGKTSIGLGRRSVTHVILGTANGHGGAGGGLAATKIQKEIVRVGGKGVKFVGVKW
jgi:hypothetical protein